MKRIQWIALLLIVSSFAFQGVSRAEGSLAVEEAAIAADTHVPEALDSGKQILDETQKDEEEDVKDDVDAIPAVPAVAEN